MLAIVPLLSTANYSVLSAHCVRNSDVNIVSTDITISLSRLAAIIVNSYYNDVSLYQVLNSCCYIADVGLCWTNVIL